MRSNDIIVKEGCLYKTYLYGSIERQNVQIIEAILSESLPFRLLVYPSDTCDRRPPPFFHRLTETCLNTHMASRDISLERDQIRQYPRSSDEEKTLPNDGPSSTRVDEPPRDMGTVRWVLTCSALYSATLLYGLDTTIVADVQVSIVERFGEISKLTWIGAAFPLGSVAIILPLGVMYESFNYKWLYVSSFILFEAGSALCGGSPNMNALILGRVIAGMGGSGLYLG